MVSSAYVELLSPFAKPHECITVEGVPCIESPALQRAIGRAVGMPITDAQFMTGTRAMLTIEYTRICAETNPAILYPIIISSCPSAKTMVY